MPYVYLNGDGGGATAMHVEDWYMNSMNLCYAGFKLWLLVERDDQNLLERKFKEAKYIQGVDVMFAKSMVSAAICTKLMNSRPEMPNALPRNKCRGKLDVYRRTTEYIGITAAL